MAESTPSPTAVNNAIMAAADQVLAGLKGGGFFPPHSYSFCSASSSSNLNNVPHNVAEEDEEEQVPSTKEPLPQTKEMVHSGNDVLEITISANRCTPTEHILTRQKEEVLGSSAATNANDDSRCCINQNCCSQVTLEDHQEDNLNKIASASSLTSSELSDSEQQKRTLIMGPPMHHVSFTSTATTGTGSGTLSTATPPATESGTTASSSLGKRDSTAVNHDSDEEAVEPPKQKRCLSRPSEGAPMQHANPPPADLGVVASMELRETQLHQKSPHHLEQSSAQSQPSGQTSFQHVIDGAPQANARQVEVQREGPLPLQHRLPPQQPPHQSQPPPLTMQVPAEQQSQGQVIPPRQSPAMDASSQRTGGHQPHPNPILPNQSLGPIQIQPRPKEVPIAPAPGGLVHYQHQRQLQQQWHPNLYPQLRLNLQQHHPAPFEPAPPHPHRHTTYYTKNLPPIYPKPNPTEIQTQTQQLYHLASLHHHQEQQTQAPHSGYQQPLLPKPYHASNTSHIPLDHVNYQQQTAITTSTTNTNTTSDPPTATLAAATPGPHTAHQYYQHHPASVKKSHTSTNHKGAPATDTRALSKPSFVSPAPTVDTAGTFTTEAPTPGTSQLLSSCNTADKTPSAPFQTDLSSSSLRNQRMQATDCLLFAASLLQDVPTGLQVAGGDTTAASSTAHLSAESTVSSGSPPLAPKPQNDQLCPTQQQGQSFASLSAQKQDAHQFGGDSAKLPLLPQHPSYAQDQPRELDVLCGRGGLINKHVGNIIYRRVVEYNKPFYQSVQKRHRILVSQSIVHTILKRGGRFLSEDTKTVTNADGTTSSVTLWKTVATARAIQKTSQALRERVVTTPTTSAAGGASASKTAAKKGGSMKNEAKDLSTTGTTTITTTVINYSTGIDATSV